MSGVDLGEREIDRVWMRDQGIAIVRVGERRATLEGLERGPLFGQRGTDREVRRHARPYRLRHGAVSAVIGEKTPPNRPGRMNTLSASSGRVAAFAQNFGHTPFRSRYVSTLET